MRECVYIMHHRTFSLKKEEKGKLVNSSFVHTFENVPMVFNELLLAMIEIVSYAFNICRQ